MRTRPEEGARDEDAGDSADLEAGAGGPEDAAPAAPAAVLAEDSARAHSSESACKACRWSNPRTTESRLMT
jgi:hypothetical protein